MTPKGKPIRMMGPKLKELRDTIPRNLKLKAAFIGGKLFDELEAWKEKRNVLMHAMVNETMDIPATDALAEDGANGGGQACY